MSYYLYKIHSHKSPTFQITLCLSSYLVTIDINTEKYGRIRILQLKLLKNVVYYTKSLVWSNNPEHCHFCPQIAT